MQSLPDRTQLSAAEKDDLIRSLSERVEALTAKVAELEGRLALNSQNSSKPPSSDGYGKPKPKSLRGVGKNPTGGQKGHRGQTLERSEHPDHSVPHAPPVSCECGLTLPSARWWRLGRCSICRPYGTRSPSTRSWSAVARAASPIGVSVPKA